MRNPDLGFYRGYSRKDRSDGNAAVDINNSSDTKEPQPKSEPLVIFSDITTEGILKELGISVFKTKLALNNRNYTRLPRILNLLLRGYDISKIDIKEKRKIVKCYIEIFTSKNCVYNRAMDDKGLIETLRERLRAQLTDKKLMHAIWPEYQIDDGQGTDEELLKRYLEEKIRREGKDSQQKINRDEYLLTMSPKTCRVPESRKITNTSEITNKTKPRLSLVSENNFNAAEEETEELKKIFSEENIFSQTETFEKPTDVQEKIKVKPVLKTGEKPDTRENIVVPVTTISRQKLVEQLRENLPENISAPIPVKPREIKPIIGVKPKKKVNVRVSE